MGRVTGKVAFITGAARGQGRSHAVTLAGEGADIIAVDLCRDVDTLKYSLARREDLDETADLVRKAGGKILAIEADVRAAEQMRAAVRDGLAEFGKIDVVVAQAGIAGMQGDPKDQAWIDVINTNLIGTINAIQAALPHLPEGASVIATGSTAGLMQTKALDNPGSDPGGIAYPLSKRLLSTYVHEFAAQFAHRKIRANVIHPTNCNTPMLHSEPMYQAFRPDLPNPTREDAEVAFPVQQIMPVPYVEPEDISEMVLFLASDASRYVSGMQMRVDAGGYLRWYDYHV